MPFTLGAADPVIRRNQAAPATGRSDIHAEPPRRRQPMSRQSPLILLALLALVGTLTFASGPARGQEDAGRLDKRFDRPPPPRAEPEGRWLPVPEQAAPDEASRIRFQLRALQFEGNTRFDDADLAALAADLVGREVSLADLYAVRDAITRRYGAAGYGLSFAVVPPQRLQAEGGVARIRIVEGYVADVEVEGTVPADRAFLDHAIERILAQRPLDVRTLERYLLLANDRFAIRASAFVKASDHATGASTLVIRVDPAPRVQGRIALDNRGTRAVGPGQVTVGVDVDGLFGDAAQTSATYATAASPRELGYLGLSQRWIVGDEGDMVAIGYSRSRSRPGTALLSALGQETGSEGWSLTATRPLVRTRARNLSVYLKFDERRSHADNLGTRTQDDALPSLRLGVTHDQADAWDGVTATQVELSGGIGGRSRNADPLKSRADGHYDYRKLTWQLRRLQGLGRLGTAWQAASLQLGLLGQVSPTGLLSGEECGLGGGSFGRAYDPSEILGDSCLAASVELRFQADPAVQFYGFADGGITRDHAALAATIPARRRLASTGLGLRWHVAAGIDAEIEIAKPLGRDVAAEGDRRARVFGSLGAQL